MDEEKVSELQQALYLAAKADSSRRFHSLYDKICRKDVLKEAWNRVRKNGGAAGTDGKAIEEIEQQEEGIEAFLTGIAKELRDRTYRPSPLRRVWIPKPNGKRRGLGIPTVKDRVVQTAAKLVLEPIFEPDFEPNSYGFRPGKSAHEAVMEIVKRLNFGCEQVIDADITACFDTIPRGLLIREVARRVVDGAMLHLVKQWLDVGILDGGVMTHTEVGIPQGSPLSPLLANTFLDQLDKGWKRSGLPSRERADAHLIRFADDFVILGIRDMNEAMTKLNEIMGGMGLTLSTEKTRPVNAEDGFDFLGFHFVRHYSKQKGKRTTRWFPSAKAQKRISERIRQLTDKSLLSTTNPYEAREKVVLALRGWGEYFRHSMATEVFAAVWGYADARLGRMERRWHQKPHIGRSGDRVKHGLSLIGTRVKPVPYGAYYAAR